MDSAGHLTDERSRLRFYRLLRLLGTFWPCAVVLWVVPGRLFVAPDSTQYLSAARNLLAGNGLASYWWSGRPEPLTHFPPLFPFILALFGWVGLDMERAALWLNIVALATIVWQSSRLAGLLAGGSAVQRARVMAVCALAVGFAHDVTYVSVILFTEPLFVALSLGAISALVSWLDGAPAITRSSPTAGPLRGVRPSAPSRCSRASSGSPSSPPVCSRSSCRAGDGCWTGSGRPRSSRGSPAARSGPGSRTTDCGT